MTKIQRIDRNADELERALAKAMANLPAGERLREQHRTGRIRRAIDADAEECHIGYAYDARGTQQ